MDDWWVEKKEGEIEQCSENEEENCELSSGAFPKKGDNSHEIILTNSSFI